MSRPLTDIELDHLLNFIGYGRLDADIWFLGMEEAGGGRANIRTRLKFHSVMDNAQAHAMLGVTHLHWGRRKIQRTWRGMCYIMLRLESNEATTANIRAYQSLDMPQCLYQVLCYPARRCDVYLTTYTGNIDGGYRQFFRQSIEKVGLFKSCLGKTDI